MNNIGYPGQGPDMSQLLGNQAKLFQKVLKVVEGVEKIEKSGYNSHQKYHYSTEQDLVNAVRDLLLKNGLLVLTDSETKEVVKLPKTDKNGQTKDTLVTVVNTRHTFCDAETGYTYPIQSTGAGWDDTDKGVYKGLTGAMKYFISKNFLVPTEDDPENDGVTAVKQTKGFSRTSQVAAKVTTEVKAEQPLVIDNKEEETSTTVENFSKEEVTQVKPGFKRRSANKQEPNFP